MFGANCFAARPRQRARRRPRGFRRSAHRTGRFTNPGAVVLPRRVQRARSGWRRLPWRMPRSRSTSTSPTTRSARALPRTARLFAVAGRTLPSPSSAAWQRRAVGSVSTTFDRCPSLGRMAVGTPVRGFAMRNEGRGGQIPRHKLTELRPFQRRFMAAATADGVDTAALSMPRGNGKSWLASRLAIRALTPGDALFVPGSESVAVAAALAQARVIFRFVRKRPWSLSGATGSGIQRIKSGLSTWRREPNSGCSGRRGGA